MLYEYEKLSDVIEGMKRMAIMLVPHSYPNKPEDSDINFFKQREIVVDGYTLVVSFNRCDYQGVYLDVLSFTGKYMPYLPMPLLCKVGEAFLGNKELTFNEVLRSGRKFYSWMVLYKADGTPISNSFVNNGINDSFNGLEFTRCGTGDAMQVPPT
jgi:hypothetical protein